ncbi:MAG: hypothetical protein IKU42_00005 [Oscillospiraceae bacterium]|nr:hypothetical protein [Oscillospiraceae bacterium]
MHNVVYSYDNLNRLSTVSENGAIAATYTYAPSISSIMQSGNLYVYVMNIPTDMLDSSGHIAQWLSDSFDFIKNKIINPILNYYNPNTFTIGGQFQDEIFYGIGTLTGGYSEYNCRLQINANTNQANGLIGIFGKISTGNATGKIGIKTDNTTISLKGVGDGLTGTAQAGMQYKDGFGLIGKAKASVLTGRTSIELEVSGWQFEIGVSGDILSVGAEAMVGYFPEYGFTAKSSIGAGWFGWGFLFRAKPTMMLER